MINLINSTLIKSTHLMISRINTQTDDKLAQINRTRLMLLYTGSPNTPDDGPDQQPTPGNEPDKAHTQ
jgi:hypothetical protein